MFAARYPERIERLIKADSVDPLDVEDHPPVFRLPQVSVVR